MPFEPVILGRTGLRVGRLGMAASYGVPTAAVERAFERGVNYLYWGSLRRRAFAQAIRNLAPQRDRLVVVVQSFSRVARVLEWSLEYSLRRLRLDHADILLFGLWNKPLAPRILEAGLKLQQRGLTRFLALSTHHRPLAAQLAADSTFAALHVRYNAEHPGAEKDVFPFLPEHNRPGIVAFTATSWGRLLTSHTAADCYRFVLSNPAVDVCLTGPSTAAHAEQAFEALDRGPMSPDEVSRMRHVA
jgi:aryl-alcohol dehydrogenase-like predicted oxidoreductase